jgi:hypothetical protein
MMRYVAGMGQMGNAHTILVRKLARKRPIQISRYRCGIILKWILKKWA